MSAYVSKERTASISRVDPEDIREFLRNDSGLVQNYAVPQRGRSYSLLCINIRIYLQGIKTTKVFAKDTGN
jgi:hypothetical protein